MRDSQGAGAALVSDSKRVAHALTQRLSAEVLLDFDYTLFGSNSTERYLAHAKPTLLVSMLLCPVRYLIPWRLIAGRGWFRIRDYFSVLIVTVLTPWNLSRWQRDAPRIFEMHSSHPLADVIAGVPVERITIVSFGFDRLINALLRQSRWKSCRRICLPFLINPARLSHGKFAMIKRVLTDEQIQSAMMITDSEDDRDVLDAVADPFLIHPTGPHFSADIALYLPLRYTAMAKYNRRFVWDQVFCVEFIIVILATAPAWVATPAIFFSALPLFISLYAIYEIGYFENDQLAARNEERPVVSAKSDAFKDSGLKIQAWLWATCLGAMGCTIDSMAQTNKIELLLPKLAVWLLVLVLVRLLFFIYNRRASGRRLLIYPALQAAKLFGVFALLPPSLLGIALAFAQMVMMWMNYAIYRAGGDKSSFPRDGVRLVAFTILSLGIVVVRHAKMSTIDYVIGTAMFAWAIGRHFSPKLIVFARRNPLSKPD
jgi:hypothetical protein